MRTYTYDTLDRLKSFGSGTLSHAYDYDANGNRTVFTIAPNSYQFDYSIPFTSNRLQTATGPGVAKTFTYDAAGNIIGDGSRTWTYDDRGRMKQFTGSLGTTDYLVNGLGERVRKSGAGVPDPRHYVYDPAGRMIGEYDPAFVVQETIFLGDIPVLSHTGQETGVDNANISRVVTSGTWLTGTTDQGMQGPNYFYKAQGTGSATVTWSLPIPVATSYQVYASWTSNPDRASNAPYTINHAGGSTTITVNQKENAGEWVPLGTYNLSPTQNTVVLSDNADGVVVADAIKVVRVEQSTTIRYIHADHLNTPLVVRSSDGVIRWVWDTTPFGESAPNETPGGNLPYVFNHRFPGQYFDVESGLHYNYFRDFSPPLGRYVQSDPIGLQGGINTYSYVDSVGELPYGSLNTYAYASGNPMSRIDPLGLTDLFYNNATRTLTVVSAGGAEAVYPASNNAASTSRGPWPQGTFPFERHNPHPNRSAASDTGTDFFGFRVPRRSDMGVHAGRRGMCDLANRCDSDYATLGCIRTTPEAIDAIRRLHTGGDPLRQITVIR